MSVSPRLEKAETHELPFEADRAQEGGVGDVVVADVVDLEAARAGVAQHHVGGVVAEEAAEAHELPSRSDLTQLIGREYRVVADVVDFVFAERGLAQDHVGGGAGGRRRVRRFEKAVEFAAAILVIADDVPDIVDPCRGIGALAGHRAGLRIVDRGVDAVEVEETVVAARVVVGTDDLAGVVDAQRTRGGGRRDVERHIAPVGIEEAVEPVGAVDVVADDLMRVVDALRVRPLTVGAAGAREGIVDLGVEAPSGVEQEAVEWAGAGQKEADDLVRIVDALRNGLDRAQRVVERGVCSVAVDIAVEPEPAVLVRADDVAEIVDAVRLR